MSRAVYLVGLIASLVAVAYLAHSYSDGDVWRQCALSWVGGVALSKFWPWRRP